MAELKEFIWGTGRRKSAVARVRLSRGSGVITVNRRPFEKYFLTIDDHGVVRSRRAEVVPQVRCAVIDARPRIDKNLPVA